MDHNMVDILVDHTFYQSSYGGTLPRTLFVAGVRQAQGIILSLLYPRTTGDLDAAGYRAVQLAICAQVESGLDKPVTEDGNATLDPGVLRIHGMPVAAGAVGVLRQAGLLGGWL